MSHPKIAIIGGSGLRSYGNSKFLFMPRHANGLPPHRIDHKKNILDLVKKRIGKVIGVCSVGSLRLAIPPGIILVPHDYIQLTNIPTFHDRKAVHILPGLDKNLRQLILKAAKKQNIKIISRGVYWQTPGPRFETPAEIRLMGKFADVVGMTMASEATLAKEKGLSYAAVCMVDNYGNGLYDPLGPAAFELNQRKNLATIKKLLDAISILT